jgi:hypothetical protein
VEDTAEPVSSTCTRKTSPRPPSRPAGNPVYVPKTLSELMARMGDHQGARAHLRALLPDMVATLGADNPEIEGPGVDHGADAFGGRVDSDPQGRAFLAWKARSGN